MPVRYIPVVKEHKCKCPDLKDSFQTGSHAPRWSEQIDAGIFYECDGCNEVWRLRADSEGYGEYHWVILWPCRLWPSWRLYLNAKKSGILANRDDDSIVEELKEC